MHFRSTQTLALLLLLIPPVLRMTAQPAPLPDRFADAALVSGGTWGLTTQISAVVASAEPGEPAHAGQPARASQWIRFRYPDAGYIALSVGPTRGFRFAVYTGDRVDALTEVASVQVSSKTSTFGFEVEAGVTYSLAVDLPVGADRSRTMSALGRYHREFLRPRSPALPTRSPASVTLDAVLLEPGEEFREVTFLVNLVPVLTRREAPWSVTVDHPAGGTLSVTARVNTNRRFSVPLPPWEFRTLPPNDAWAEATPIAGDATDWTGDGSLEFATAEPGEPEFIPGMPVDRSVWWRWTPGFSGPTRFFLQPQYGTLQVFTGDALDQMIPVPADPSVGFPAQAGQPYALRLAVANGQIPLSASLILQRPALSLRPPPPFVIETDAAGGRVVYVTEGIAHEFAAEALNPQDLFGALHLQRSGPSDWETAEISTGAPHRFTLQLPPDAFTEVRLAGTNQAGVVRLSDPMWVVAAPRHDRFADAVVLPAEGLSDWNWHGVSRTGREAGEPPSDGPASAGTLWFRWTPNASVTASLRLSSVGGATTVAVYTGDSLSSLQRIASKTISEPSAPLELPVPVSAGILYHFAVSGAEPSVPAVLELLPIQVSPVASELHLGVAVTLSATRIGASPAPEVSWTLNGEPLLRQTPDPESSSTWTPAAAGPFTLRASVAWADTSITLMEFSGWIRPANDQMADAAAIGELAGLPGFFTAGGTLTAASREPEEPSSFPDPQGTIWYEWTAPGNRLRVRQVAGSHPVRMDIFSMDAGGGLIPIQSLGDLLQANDLRVSAGSRYRLAISSVSPEAGAFEIQFGPAPANDDFADATELAPSASGGSVSIATANIFATTEPAEELLPGFAPFRRHGSLWWKFTAPEFGGALFHLLDSPTPNTAAVYTGSALTNLQLLVGPEAAGDNPVAWVPFSVRPGVTYWIAAGGHPERDAVLGPVAGQFEFVAAPELVNDRFADRIRLEGNELSFTGTTRNATVEPGEPPGVAHSLWWEWTAPAAGAVRIRATPLDFGGTTAAFLFTGNTLDQLRPATVTDEIYVSAGQRVVIAVGIPNAGSPGIFELTLRWRPVTPPSANDRFAERPVLPADSFQTAGNLQDATLDPGEAPAGPGGSLWWRFVAPVSGVFEVTELSTDSFAPAAELYSGDTLETLRPADLPDLGNRTAWKVSGGGSYSLRIAALAGTPGEFRLQTRFWSPTNDAFADAVLLAGEDLFLDTWLVAASTESGEPLPAAGVGQSLWWRWVAPADGRLEQPGVAEGIPPAAVYTGDSLDRLAPLPGIPASPDRGMAWAVRVAAGQTCYFQYTAAAGAAVPLRFQWRFGVWGAADNDRFTDARRLEGNSVASMASAVGATREPGEPVHGTGEALPSLWWRYTPSHDGTAIIDAPFGSLRDVVLTVYRGTAVDALTRLAAGTNTVTLPVERGEAILIAAEVPEDAVGDVGLRIVGPRGGGPSREPAGNLVRNFSFERVVEENPTADWEVIPSVWWALNAPPTQPAADGANYLIVNGAILRQVLPTTAGTPYRLRLALRAYADSGEVDVRIRINGSPIGRFGFPSARDEMFWHWREAEFNATGSSAVLEIESAAAHVALDAISVVSLVEPPRPVAGPTELLTVVGGSVTLTAGVSGAEPLSFRWLHDGQPLLNANGRLLTLNPVRLDDAGEYRAQVSNPWGTATSAPIHLVVESDRELRLIRQPVGEAVLLGQYFALDVLAFGAPQFEYQWHRDGDPVPGATERQLIFEAIGVEDLGTYHAVVRSGGQTVTSLPARLTAAPATAGGGITRIASRHVSAPDLLVQVTDADGITLLEGDRFVVQLYAGNTPDTLRPVGVPQPFLPGNLAGQWIPQVIVLPQVAPGATFHAQIRAWERAAGASYEEARALGGKFGRSVLVTAVAGDPATPPDILTGFQSFSLQSGQPGFTAGRIEPVQIGPDGSATWRLTGASGFRYLVERQTGGADWTPFEVYAPFPGEVTFTTPPAGTGLILYRARVLD